MSSCCRYYYSYEQEVLLNVGYLFVIDQVEDNSNSGKYFIYARDD
jgi:hypothetical protein